MAGGEKRRIMGLGGGEGRGAEERMRVREKGSVPGQGGEE